MKRNAANFENGLKKNGKKKAYDEEYLNPCSWGGGSNINCELEAGPFSFALGTEDGALTEFGIAAEIPAFKIGPIGVNVGGSIAFEGELGHYGYNLHHCEGCLNLGVDFLGVGFINQGMCISYSRAPSDWDFFCQLGSWGNMGGIMDVYCPRDTEKRIMYVAALTVFREYGDCFWACGRISVKYGLSVTGRGGNDWVTKAANWNGRNSYVKVWAELDTLVYDTEWTFVETTFDIPVL